MVRMGRLAHGGTVLVTAAAGVARALRVPRRRRPGTGPDPRPARWQVVTVDRPPEQVLPQGRWPEPLRRLDGAVELCLRPAPGGRGTELAARQLAGRAALPGMAAHLVGDDPGLLIRETLRQAKQYVETGEVLRPDRSRLDRPAVPG
ncbi:hypothetical protein AB0H57_09625 [Micromonospora sp. NPDC050686]|uniref:hypothetical protein n=1 Tax=Micromonospora sp. NPDC050686 TaxID=3154631 RepID=UPI00340B78A7